MDDLPADCNTDFVRRIFMKAREMKLGMERIEKIYGLQVNSVDAENSINIMLNWLLYLSNKMPKEFHDGGVFCSAFESACVAIAYRCNIAHSNAHLTEDEGYVSEDGRSLH
eukprot:TRINITY_DN29348_c0_g1_i8.p2 TRINITY_DN29348_c0_g1~~TRINITY_DN29348_c0_g1_i8.p2  ORF type:complete len:111 (+),score=9.07 TRINITY_DN29348_c0_g1_i8:807-1139(+)